MKDGTFTVRYTAGNPRRGYSPFLGQLQIENGVPVLLFRGKAGLDSSVPASRIFLVPKALIQTPHASADFLYDEAIELGDGESENPAW